MALDAVDDRPLIPALVRRILDISAVAAPVGLKLGDVNQGLSEPFVIGAAGNESGPDDRAEVEVSKEKMPRVSYPAPHGSDYEHWREGQHYGLVFSIALALWAAGEGQSIGPASGEIAALFKWW